MLYNNQHINMLIYYEIRMILITQPIVKTVAFLSSNLLQEIAPFGICNY